MNATALRQSEEYVRRHIWQLEDATAKELYQLYKASYGELSGELASIAKKYGAGEVWTVRDVGYTQRNKVLMAQIESEMKRLTDSAMEQALDAAIRAYRGGVTGRAWALTQGAGVGADIPFLPVTAIRAQILAPYIGNTFLGRFADARDKFVNLIKRSLVQSQIQGESIYQAQQRIAHALGIEIERGTQAARAENEALFARTEMIARTEILRASNLGAMATYEANADLLNGWVLLITDDERTCEECIAANDSDRVYDLGEGPQPPIHPRCRCTPVPALKDSELQKRVAEGPKDYRAWARDNEIGDKDGGVF